MKKILSITLALTAILTISCKKTVHEEPSVDSGLELSFSSDIVGTPIDYATRAMASKDAFVTGDSIGVFVVPWQNATTPGVLIGQGNYADNVPFIAGTDPKKFAPSATDKITFPNATTKVNVYAFALYHRRYNNLGVTPTANDWTMDKNQTTALLVRKNDLMTANTLNVAPQIAAVPLKFKHRLSKVEVLFNAPETYKGEAVNGVNAVYIVNTRIGATIDMTDTTKVPVVNAAKDTVSISAYKASQTGVAYQYEAIVLPQTLPTQAIVARVVLEVGTAKKLITFDCTSDRAIAYKVGEKLQLTLAFEGENVLNLSGVTIAPWGSTPPEEAVAKRPVQILLKATGNQTVISSIKSAKLTVDARQYNAAVTITPTNDTIICSFLQHSDHFSTVLTVAQFFNASAVSVGSFSGVWQILGKPNDYNYNEVTTTLNFN